MRPALDLTSDADLAAVADVVVALDGMPLAVELAAARSSTLAPTELAARLADRFGLLTSGARTADARQRTLRATVDWSHDLLTEPEQVVFRRLAVFHGGWTLDAAERSRAGPDVPRADVLDVLSRLVDRHMVTVDDVRPGQPSRYRMLETLRQYAVDKLGAAGEADQVAAAHVAYFRELTDAAEWTLRGPGQAATVRRLRDELPNLRAAFAWLAAGEQDPTASRTRCTWPAASAGSGTSVGTWKAATCCGTSSPSTAAHLPPAPGRCKPRRWWNGPARVRCIPARGARRPPRRAWPCSSSSATPAGPPSPGCCWPSRASPRTRATRRRPVRRRCSRPPTSSSPLMTTRGVTRWRRSSGWRPT